MILQAALMSNSKEIFAWNLFSRLIFSKQSGVCPRVFFSESLDSVNCKM